MNISVKFKPVINRGRLRLLNTHFNIRSNPGLKISDPKAINHEVVFFKEDNVYAYEL